MSTPFKELKGFEKLSLAASDEKSAKTKGKLYLELIREDIGVQEHFSELLTGFEKLRPCYLRTSMTEHEISDLLLTTRAKIDVLKGFLKNVKSSKFSNIPDYQPD